LPDTSLVYTARAWIVRLEEKDMSIAVSELDQMQSNYKVAVEDWIAAIRKEEALASVNHSVAEVDQWENAGFQEEELRNKAKATKRAYEAALRQEFYDF
jgi:RES domain-containing protein